MLTRYNEYEPAFTMLSAFRQQFDRLFDDNEGGAYAGGPRVEVYETPEAFVLSADMPGLTEKDVTVTVTQDVLLIAGERRSSVPEGYRPHRRERTAFQFNRSFSLPAKTDVERVTATVKEGVLTVELPKAPEVKPRQITVKAT